MIVVSNYAPTLVNEEFVLSRLLYVRMGPMTGPRMTSSEVEALLIPELPGFLAYARRCYAERCPDGYAIRGNAVHEAMVQELLAESNQPFEDIIEKHFCVHPKGRIRKTEVKDVLGQYSKMFDKFDVQDGYETFFRYLEKQHGVVTKRSNGWCCIGLAAKNFTDPLKAAADPDDEKPRLELVGAFS